MAEEKKPAEEAPREHQELPYTSERFIVKCPLYTTCAIEEGFSAPARISYDCDNPTTCGKETTWALIDKPEYRDIGRGLAAFHTAQYVCSRCGGRFLSVMYREVDFEMRKRRPGPVPPSIGFPAIPVEERVTTKVQKIGQYPPLSIRVPKSLEKGLGNNHTALYKKALISRNEGFGLGAVGYIRRVVEDKTEELIEVVAQLAEAHQIDQETIKTIRTAKNEKTTYDNKLKIASTVIPASLLIDGVNPLDVLFGLVSAGLHDLTEEECIAIADETQSVFEYTFTRLRAQIDERKDFAAKVKKWAGGSITTAKKPTS